MKGNLKQRIIAMLLCAAMLVTSVNLTNLFDNDMNASSSLTSNEAYNFEYTGNVQEWTCAKTGIYKFEVWGASGGGCTDANGKYSGGYTVITLKVYEGEKYYVYCGEEGSYENSINKKTYGDGGAGLLSPLGYYNGSGGGATSIRSTGGDIRYNYDKQTVTAGGGGGKCGTTTNNETATMGNQGGGRGINSAIVVDSHGESTDYVTGAAGGGFVYSGNDEENTNYSYHSQFISDGSGGAAFYDVNKTISSNIVVGGNKGNGKASITYIEPIKNNITFICGVDESQNIVGTYEGQSDEYGNQTNSYEYGETITLKAAQKEHWTFEYWTISNDTSGEKYYVGDSITMGKENINLVAHYSWSGNAIFYSVDDLTDIDTTTKVEHKIHVNNIDDGITKYIKFYSSEDGGLTFDEVTSKGYALDPLSTNLTFSYTGSPETIVIKTPGKYKLTAWGANGGSSYSNQGYANQNGSKGNYLEGVVNLQYGNIITVYVGQAGKNGTYTGTDENYGKAYGFGTGGAAYRQSLANGKYYGNYQGAAGGGGGATAFTLNGTALENRLLVSGGGGGAGSWSQNYMNSTGNSPLRYWSETKGFGGSGTQDGAAGGGEKYSGAGNDRRLNGGGGGGWYGGSCHHNGTNGVMTDKVSDIVSTTEVANASSYTISTANGSNGLIQAATDNGSATLSYLEGETKVMAFDADFIVNPHDSVSPNEVSDINISKPNDNLTISWTPSEDNGNDYLYKAEIFDATTDQKLYDCEDLYSTESPKSETISINATSGTKGYFYYIDNSSTSLDIASELTLLNEQINEDSVTIDETTIIYTSELECETDISTTQRYIHIAAVDYAGNISTTSTFSIPVGLIISYDKNSSTATGIVDSQILTEGESTTLNENAFVNNGYDFMGWNTKTDGTGDSYVDQQAITYDDILSQYRTGVHLYAQWKAHTSTLIVDPDGGEWNSSSEIQSFTQEYGTTKNIPIPSKIGWHFLGWIRTNTYGTMDSLTIATTYNFSSIDGVTDTLTASWAIDTYSISYNANGGLGIMDDEIKTYGQNYTILTNGFITPTKDFTTQYAYFYEFAGWNTKADGTGITYEAGDIYTENVDLTLYAQWEEIEILRSYNVICNDYIESETGTLLGKQSSKTYDYGTTAKGSDWGADPNSVYYDKYIYLGCSEVTVDGPNLIVNRYFKLGVVNYNVIHQQEQLDGTYKTVETELLNGIIGTEVTPSVKTYIGYISPSPQKGIILADGSLSITYKYELNYYTVTYVDVIDSEIGTVFNTTTEQVHYGKVVNGADKGSDLNDNTYYYGYYLDRTTSETVDVDGATVYRIFKLRTININGSVNWNDKSNAYGSRQENVTITLFRNGTKIDTITGLTDNDNNSFSFKGLQKYDTSTGEAYVYTVSQSDVTSLNSPEDKYTTTIDTSGLNFTNTLGNADFHIEGSIIWEDYEDKFGTRPSEIELKLYQNGVLHKTQVIDKNATGYSFVNLDKYDDDLNPYTYKVEEVFTAKTLTWNATTKQYEEIDAYAITVDGFDFTNTLVDTEEKPIIPVKPSHINTLTIKLDFNDNINWTDIEKKSSEVTSFVTLKQMEMLMNDGTVLYTSNYNGMEYKAVVNESGVTINNIPSGKYEIVESNDNTFILEGIDLQTNSSISVVNENNKWYLIISETNENQTGIISLNMNIDSFNGVDDSMVLNNLYSLENTSTAQVMMLSMFSDEVTVPEYVEPITYTITYKKCDVMDDTKYSENSEATLKDCEIEGFLGWSENSEAIETQYIAGDKVKLEKDLILYPIIETSEQSSEKTTEEEASEEKTPNETEESSEIEETTEEPVEENKASETETSSEIEESEENNDSVEDSEQASDNQEIQNDNIEREESFSMEKNIENSSFLE